MSGEDDGPPQISGDAVFEGLWQKVIDGFDDDDRHARFIEYCGQKALLAEGARRYRQHQQTLGEDTNEETRALVDKKLGLVTILTLQQLESSRQPPQPHHLTRIVAIVAAVITIGTMIAAAQALLQR